MSLRLKRQLRSRTFRSAVVCSMAEGGKLYAGVPWMWWVLSGIALLAIVAIGWYAEDV